MTELGRNAIGLARNRAVTAARRAAGAGSGCAAANGRKSAYRLGKCDLEARKTKSARGAALARACKDGWTMGPRW